MKRIAGILVATAFAAAVALPAQAERLRGLVPSTVTSPDGLSIAVVESGETTGRPILFVHGFSQSAAAWRRQMLSDLGDGHRLVAFDLRGHGYSSKPADPKHYVARKLWADDIAAVVAAKGLKDVVLVGWSYGGLPMLDYVKAHGQGKLSALVFVATGYNLDLRPPDKGGPEMVLGPGVIENTGPMAGIPAGPPGADLDGCGKAKTCGAYGAPACGNQAFPGHGAGQAAARGRGGGSAGLQHADAALYPARHGDRPLRQGRAARPFSDAGHGRGAGALHPQRHRQGPKTMATRLTNKTVALQRGRPGGGGASPDAQRRKGASWPPIRDDTPIDLAALGHFPL